MAANRISDRVSGLILFLLGIGAALHGYGLQVAFAADPIGPKAFPIIAGLILTISGASVALRPSEVQWESGERGRVILVAVASLMYPLILVPLGFVPATAILAFLVSKAFRGTTMKSAIAATCIAGAIFLLIDLGLGLGLPRGPLGI